MIPHEPAADSAISVKKVPTPGGVADHPERALVLAYAPAPARAGLAAMLALDDRLAALALRPGDAGLAAIRMAWWREALAGLGRGPRPADPLLLACLDAGLAGEALAATTAGWDAVIDDPALDDATVAAHASERGVGLFAVAGALLGDGDDPRLAAAGAGWALADLARRLPQHRERLRAAADRHLDAAAGHWPRVLRPLGQLALAARLDATELGPRRRLLRILRFHLTGR